MWFSGLVDMNYVQLANRIHKFTIARLGTRVCNRAIVQLYKPKPPDPPIDGTGQERRDGGGSQKAFGTKMKTKFAWELNNSRPRYLNVCIKSAKPTLRVVG
jgi:hypothetical protein